MTISEQVILETGLTTKGSPYIEASELEASLAYLWNNRAVIQSMEAFEPVDDENFRMDMSFGIYGLDGDENWENHNDPKRAIMLVRQKITNAKQANTGYQFKVWLVKVPNEEIDAKS